MNVQLCLLILLSSLISACATPQPPKSHEFNKGEASLAEASFSVSRSLVDLAETAQASHPLAQIPAGPHPAAYGMGGLTSIDWSGPIEPLLKQIALSSGYRLRVLGTAPAIPIIVTIYEKNVMLGDALRNIGFQGGRRATVAIYPESRVIELRYAKN